MVASGAPLPLSIAVDQNKTETIVSSDPNTLVGAAYDVIFLAEGEIARIKKGAVEVLGEGFKKVMKKTARIEGVLQSPSKDGFRAFHAQGDVRAALNYAKSDFRPLSERCGVR